ncbi:Methyltransferase domain-containing protein [Muriicola jejuensis]|uniref:Methyltransferase domain-containing protein n=1 Tax=Muriicola jejuensis TaxID=504488 RepID=A0A6P0U978_9FLAO|nr:class I SAM-dependent methyltransferase [Muriicola jejuensis]NER09714.1 methyltransferase domain-containing protein [Muriicola jejuensis]SMP06289.1 Methyltransferase domain-containing protein [Muriicola jejuensis]
MNNFDRKAHWERVYQTKELKDAGWYQPVPKTSLDFIEAIKLPLDSRIIDIGGGDSLLVDHLLKLGYRDVTILDISETAIERAKARLGDLSGMVKWVVSDVSNFRPSGVFDFWHDRATFHFLTDKSEISNYVETARQSIRPEGILFIGTFSDRGPKSCSGIEIRQYSALSMSELFKKYFKNIQCFTVDHKTPSGNLQNYVFCGFKRLKENP